MAESTALLRQMATANPVKIQGFLISMGSIRVQLGHKTGVSRRQTILLATKVRTWGDITTFRATAVSKSSFHRPVIARHEPACRGFQRTALARIGRQNAFALPPRCGSACCRSLVNANFSSIQYRWNRQLGRYLFLARRMIFSIRKKDGSRTSTFYGTAAKSR